MALSNLTFLNNGDSPNIDVTSYPLPPTVKPGSGNLENEVGYNVWGYQTGNTNVLVFRVVDSMYTSSALSLNRDNSAIDIVDSRDADENIEVSFYSVDMGLDTVNGGDWSLTLQTTLKDGTTPSYIFVKGKTGDDIPMYS